MALTRVDSIQYSADANTGPQIIGSPTRAGAGRLAIEEAPSEEHL